MLRSIWRVAKDSEPLDCFVVPPRNNRGYLIIANNTSSVNKYVQKAVLNGKVLNSFKFPAKELSKGGTLELSMGAEPNRNWDFRSDTLYVIRWQRTLRDWMLRRFVLKASYPCRWVMGTATYNFPLWNFTVSPIYKKNVSSNTFT